MRLSHATSTCDRHGEVLCDPHMHERTGRTDVLTHGVFLPVDISPVRYARTTDGAIR
jgi:hypothetical protein